MTGSDLGWLLCGEQTVRIKVEAGRADIQVREESGLNWGAGGGAGEKILNTFHRKRPWDLLTVYMWSVG